MFELEKEREKDQVKNISKKILLAKYFSSSHFSFLQSETSYIQTRTETFQQNKYKDIKTNNNTNILLCLFE